MDLEQQLASAEEQLEQVVEAIRGNGGPLGDIIVAGLVLLAAWLALVLARRVLVPLAHRAVERTNARWDDALKTSGVFSAMAWLAPAMVLGYALRFLPEWVEQLQPLLTLYGVVVGFWTAGRALRAVERAILSSGMSRRAPLRSMFQMVRLFVYLTGAVIAAGVLMGTSPWGLLSGIGAFTAVLMLVFRDTILSFVAAIQISASESLRPGDWVEMPDFGANGDVVDVSLNHVTIQNFDKTVAVIPTHKFLDSSFRNWRGMQEAGGRRIMRSLLIDQSTVRLADEGLLESVGRIDLLRDYLAHKRTDIDEANAASGAHTAAHPANGRRQTNLGLFRAYVAAYLRSRPDIRKDMTFLVRQLQPTSEGLPLEVYVFTDTTVWAEYEGIQADIFDHLLAVMPLFGLGVYQRVAHVDERVAPLGLGAGAKDAEAGIRDAEAGTKNAEAGTKDTHSATPSGPGKAPSTEERENKGS